MGPPTARFWERPIETLNREEWEALCDGCGQCCRHKVEDEDTGRVWPTNVGCRLLDLRTGQCSDYKNRRKSVPDCVQLTAKLAHPLPWLPVTCAYRLRAEDQPLPDSAPRPRAVAKEDSDAPPSAAKERVRGSAGALAAVPRAAPRAPHGPAPCEAAQQHGPRRHHEAPQEVMRAERCVCSCIVHTQEGVVHAHTSARARTTAEVHHVDVARVAAAVRV